eukprot:scaffold85658_cov81-Phaeocystis_antarctica.AAC.1
MRAGPAARQGQHRAARRPRPHRPAARRGQGPHGHREAPSAARIMPLTRPQRSPVRRAGAARLALGGALGGARRDGLGRLQPHAHGQAGPTPSCSTATAARQGPRPNDHRGAHPAARGAAAARSRGGTARDADGAGGTGRRGDGGAAGR